MRVLHVLAERGYSGGEQQLEHLVRYLADRGHAQSLVLVRGAAFAAVAKELQLPVWHVNLRRPLRPGQRSAFGRAIRASAPDVLHFGCGRSLLWGGVFALGHRVPVRLTTRRIDYPVGRAPWRAARYRRLVDHTAANCKSVRQRILDAGVPEDRVTLVHEGIETEVWRDVLAGRRIARQRLGLPAEALVVSCAATLRPRKGQRVLIEAFAEVLATAAGDAHLLLGGEGSDKAALQAEVARLGLQGRIHVPGAIQPVDDLYAATDVFVMPSFHEGLSNACLEASACGLPLIVSDVGGLPEIVEDRVTGDVVPAGDVRALKDSLSRYLADPELRRSAGDAGRDRTGSLFTAAKMASGMESLMERLVRDGGARCG